ncbi:MAG: DUF5606 domain-containing protein [Cryomorphaceae bacterium]|jgi:hypothetical protein|nr:DUF5606 domain-containing protein [Cryomorphaceae bacterium]MCO4791106.1 DUF5606 domain-containing protein [Flavobacteriales bacterium]MDA9236916.1 DUF5606 domain-containing protein [Schleiferiaceae bacterium]MBL6681815.1 DUF5606 domain-containing protein [Cryomorphaceae bacterium]MBL6867362.1 DUF5606 domain-containing protein [Cryomorphaceae bacterium]
MELRTVLSITGKPGLFKLVAQNKGGVVVESLLDGKRTSISASANVSSLGDIAIYTYEEEVPLREVFKAMSAVTGGKEALSHKSSKAELEDFFGEVLPKFDQERVYASDIKKIVQWFNILAKNELLAILDETEEEA